MSDVPIKPVLPIAQKSTIDPKKEEAQVYILELYKKLGTGYFCLNKFLGPDALQALSSLPPNQRETPWVQTQIGKAYYEMANYNEVRTILTKVHVSFNGC